MWRLVDGKDDGKDGDDGDRDGAQDPETTILPYHRWLHELLAITKRAVPDTDKTANPFRAPVTEHDPKFFF